MAAQTVHQKLEQSAVCAIRSFRNTTQNYVMYKHVAGKIVGKQVSVRSVLNLGETMEMTIRSVEPFQLYHGLIRA